MVSSVLFWTGFGLATRAWQLGLELRPIFSRESIWAYPLYGAVGGSFGYYMTGVGDRQKEWFAERKARLIEKRERRAQREAQEATA